MRKVLFALGVCLFLVSLASADTTRLYRLSGSTSSYFGAPRSGLPSTGYLAIDANGNASVVWYWTERGRRYVNQPLSIGTSSSGTGNGMVNLSYCFFRDYYVEENLVATGSAEWRLTGAWLNLGLPPSSLSGNGSSEYWNALLEGGLIDGGLTTGRGYHSARATGYKLLTGVSDTAASAAIQLFDQLLASGYMAFDDGSGGGIHGGGGGLLP